ARPRIVVGRDSRWSGDMLEAAFTAGACARGADVLRAGLLPTPGVAYLARTLENVSGGVVISASHNPIGDNGLKLFSSKGFKVPDEIEDRVEACLESGAAWNNVPTGTGVGRVYDVADAESRFVDFLCAQAETLKGLRVVLDCAHGAAARVGPTVLRRLGAEVFVLHDEPDGARINVRCGSTDLSELQARVKDTGAHLGLAFDGDADRCLAVDEQGDKVDGDQMLLAFARKSPGNQILVSTVMSNLGLEMALREIGVEMRRAAVGDRYVLEEMLRCGSVLGGEQSGHVIFLDVSTTGDGVLTAVRLADTVRAAGQPLSALTRMPQVPQLLVNVTTPHKDRLDQDSEIAAAIAEIENRLRGRGRLLVRPSGTEPMVRVMAEGPDEAELHQVVGALVRLIEKNLS
ncbi:MAG: phosphoglucosamine mutase, partial [Armatimonadetes bacterium]|nr:phosphoglucosamine mutase [Armatimonadota bacterium]